MDALFDFKPVQMFILMKMLVLKRRILKVTTQRIKELGTAVLSCLSFDWKERIYNKIDIRLNQARALSKPENEATKIKRRQDTVHLAWFSPDVSKG